MIRQLMMTTACLPFFCVAALSAPKVVVSIVPLHSLVAQVMEGVATPELLLQGQGSEHQASYGPQQLQALAAADAVFMIGQGLELKLDELSGSEAVSGKKFVEVLDFPGLTKLPLREGGTWEAHDAHEDDDHGEASFDAHVWLDPNNAEIIVKQVAAELSQNDPENAAKYQANGQAAIARLKALRAELDTMLSSVKGKPFIVFHDAFQYFENRFGLEGVGSISDASAAQPSAKRLSEVRAKLAKTKARCVLREPQYLDAAALAVIDGTNARLGVLDPIGADVIAGPDAYDTILRNVATNLVACLQQ
jgi:zinc transport system substrate-binding protein